MHIDPKTARRHTIAGFVATLLLAVAATTSCAGPPQSASTATAGAGATDATTSIARVDALIGAAPCNSDAECRVVGVGAKACGGPEGYRAWSTRTTDAKALMREVESGAAARRAEIERLGMLSNCAFTPAPAVRCTPAPSTGGPGRCVLDSAGRAGVR